MSTDSSSKTRNESHTVKINLVKNTQPAAIAAAAGVATTVSAASSLAAMSNPAVAAQAGRLAAMQAALTCTDGGSDDEDVAEELPATDHPLGFGIAPVGKQLKYHAGAVVGNTAIVAAFSLFVVVVCGGARWAYVKCRGPPVEEDAGKAASGAKHSVTFGAAVAWVRFPAVVFFPIAFVLQPTTTSAVTLLADPQPGTVMGRGLGALGLYEIVAMLVVSSVAFHRRFKETFEAVEPDHGDEQTPEAAPQPAYDDDDDPLKILGPRVVIKGLDDDDEDDDEAAKQMSGPGCVRRFGRYWFVPTTDWVALDRPHTRERLRRYGLAFEAYGPRAPWFFLSELFVSFLAGVAAGLPAAIGCLWSALLAAIIYVVYFAMLVAYRPLSTRVEAVVFTFLAFLQALASALSFGSQVMVSRGDDGTLDGRNVRAAAEQCIVVSGLVASVIGVLALLKTVADLAIEKLEKRKARRLKAASDGVHVGAGTGVLSVPLLLAEPPAGASSAVDVAVSAASLERAESQARERVEGHEELKRALLHDERAAAVEDAKRRHAVAVLRRMGMMAPEQPQTDDVAGRSAAVNPLALRRTADTQRPRLAPDGFDAPDYTFYY